MTEITEEYIESLKTENGGWTKESLELLGVPWPPPKGWKKKLLAEVNEPVDRHLACPAWPNCDEWEGGCLILTGAQAVEE